MCREKYKLRNDKIDDKLIYILYCLFKVSQGFVKLYDKICIFCLGFVSISLTKDYLMGMRLWDVAGVRVSLWDFPLSFL